jgi:hypothetical protein
VTSWTARPNETLDVLKFIFFIGLFIWIITQSRKRGRDRSLELSDVAERWGGRVVPVGFFAHPRLELWIEGHAADVTFQTGDRFKSKWTRIQVNWPCPVRLRAAPEGFTKRFRTLFGGADLKVGDGPFDQKFWVTASNEGWAREVLSAGVRQRLMGFNPDHRAIPSTVLTLDLGPSGLTLHVRRSLVDEPVMLDWFLHLAVLVLREAQARTPAEGVDLLTVEIRDGSACPVCGHGVTGGRSCPRCGAPHHDECWRYSGGCAIFACEGRARRAA